MSFLNTPFRNPKCCWSTVSSFNSVVERFRSYTPKPKPISCSSWHRLSLSLSLSLVNIYEIGIYKIICVITWKTSIKWRKPFIFKLMKFKVKEFKKLENGVVVCFCVRTTFSLPCVCIFVSQKKSWKME